MTSILTTLIWGLIKGSFESIIKSLPWAIIVERTLSRVMVASLRKLASLTTNTLDDQLVEDVISQIKRPDLPEVK